MKRKNLDWKLAVVCPMAALVLSGCYNKYPNVIEDVSQDKMLVRDLTDGQERMIDLSQMVPSDKIYFGKRVPFSEKGDTVIVRQEKIIDYRKSKILLLGGAELKFNEGLIRQRQQQHIFDSLKCAMVRENQENQR